VGFDDALTIEGIVGVERMWSIPGSVPTLLLSFADSTALLHLEPAVAPVAAAEGVTRSPTLAAGLVGEVLVQVTPVGVHLWSDVVAGTALPGFSRGEIVAGAVKGECVAAAFRDGSIAVWKVASGLQSVQELKLDHEAAAVDVSEGLLAVADWLGGVTVYDSTGARMFSATESVHASSLLFGPTSQLLAGLADGTLVTYDLAGGRTQSSLGSRPLTLVDLANTNADASPDGDVFAAGISERLSLLFIARGHPEVSASGKKGVIAAAAVSTSTGASVALATAGSVTLVRVASLKKLQVQTLDLGPKSATRLTLVPELRLLACGTVTQTLARDTGDVLQLSGMELRDPATLECEFHHNIFKATGTTC
jgi:DNA damage-binding protein 1